MNNDVANTKSKLNNQTASCLCAFACIALGLVVWHPWGLSWALTFILYGLLIFLVGNWSLVRNNVGTTVAVVFGLVGIGASVYVAEHSTQKIDSSLQNLESQINATVKETTENAVQEIRTTFYPNDFEVQVQREGRWFKPSIDQINEIRIEDKEVPLDVSLKNMADFPARSVFVQLWVVKDHFKEIQDEILDHFTKSNRGPNIVFGKTAPLPSEKGIETNGIYFIRDVMPPKTSTNLKRVALHLKGNRGLLIMKVNLTNGFIFNFTLPDRQS